MANFDPNLPQPFGNLTPEELERRVVERKTVIPMSFTINSGLSKKAARTKRHYAVAVGWMEKPELCACGAPAVHAHHPDYSKPLDVEWVCAKCHAARHRKTHCPQGHPYNEKNTILTKQGKRQCRTCNYAWNRARAAKKRALL